MYPIINKNNPSVLSYQIQLKMKVHFVSLVKEGFLKIIIPLLLLHSLTTVNGQAVNSLIPYASGFDDPVSIANCGDSRLFVVCRAGYVFAIDSAGIVSTVPFLNIDTRVKSNSSEQGLLGLAFHPEYPDSGFFYVNYTGVGDSTHISRFTVSSSNPDEADTLSELKLLTIYQPYANHNGGNLSFGPEGYLYIGLGDGGSSGDPGNRAQNLQEYLGKILRIDIDHGNPYTVPLTNPFYNDPSALGEIWALGLRNPWRFSFDRITGDLWIADVGQNNYEEIDFQPAASPGGENYGWRCYEGNSPYNTTGCGISGLYTFPIHEYSHSLGCSVSGGFVYRGSMFPGLFGRYFFADYCTNRVWTIINTGGSWLIEDFGQFSPNNFSTFGEDAEGELYIAGYSSGIIYRIGDNSSVINIEISINLEGPFSGSQMMTGLNASMNIPLIQPYNTIPWNYQGTESVAFIPNADVVDWVLVELRDATAAAVATAATAVARQAGFLLKDGRIVATDGFSSLQFNNFINHQLFIVIWHRNHLGVMSAIPLVNTGNTYSYDFSTGSGQAHGGVSGHKEIATGIWGMIAGNSDGNNTVNDIDKTAGWNEEAGHSGYEPSDFNLDAEVSNSDKNDFLIPNYSRTSQIPE
jgi:glucose/arabinose dehydrogenase